MKSKVFIDNQKKNWTKKKIGDFEIFYSGYVLNYNLDFILIKILNEIKKNISNINKIIKKFNLIGHYAIVIKRGDCIFATTDNISSIPIFYYKSNDQVYFSNSSTYLIKKFEKNLKGLNEQIKPFFYSGYTVGNNTLFDKINFLSFGQSILVMKSNIKKYELFKIKKKSNLSEIKLQNKLVRSLNEIFLDLIKSLNNRQVVISLSAGYDSRLVLSMLKKLNYNNIICYSYGMNNNSESIIAKKICKQLGVRFYFDELKLKSERKFYNSIIFKKYLSFSDMHHSVQYFQGISTLYRMKKRGIINKDAIIVTGNGGDYISGLHLSGYLKAKLKDKKNLYNFIINKHYNLWNNKDNKIRNEIVKIIKYQKKNYQKRFKSKINSSVFYELYEYENRQSKYVVNMNRVAEFFGYKWRMPLYDKRFVSYWNQVPDKFKIDQKMYTKTIKRTNPANVWTRSIPVNKKKNLSNLSKIF